MTAIPGGLASALSDRYRIERELGQGGMATVYLAQDLKHDRKVAVKVLKPELAAIIGAGRFLAEIKVTANLQHPHILPLHDSGEVNGTVFYVMPFVQGESLRDKLSRETQLPIGDAVRIATEVASALEYAHQHGVIHRDIKPENILLHGGHALVADFGIALAATSAGSRMTETGMSLGTPTYMSPEQAMGQRTLDARTDVYALGCVLYEMLTGEPPFSGPTAQAIVAKVMTEKPVPPSSARDTVPEAVEDAVLAALAKLPADRPASAAAFAAMLDGRTSQPAPSVARGADGQKRRRPTHSSSRLPVTVLALTTIGFAALAGWALNRGRSEPRDIGLPPDAPIQTAGQFRTYAVARDGSFIVYLARVGEVTQLWYRSLGGTDNRAIPGTEGAGGTPRLSPDGTRVVFQVAGELKLATLGGGTVTTIGRVQDPHGGEWLADGRLFFADNDGRLLRWIDPGAGSASRELGIIYCVNPQLLGEERILCGGGADHFAFVVSLDHPDRKTPLRSSSGSVLVGSHFRVIDGRYLVYMSVDGTLTATSITNLDSLTFGRSVPLVPKVRRSGYSGVGQFDITDNGTLTYVPGINADFGHLVRVARDGRLVPLTVEPAAYLRFTPSPDGRRLATVAQGLQQQELKVFDLESGTQETLDTAFYIGAPAWSPDGSALAYRRSEDPAEESLLLRRLDSPDRPVTLLSDRPPLALQVSSWLSPDSLLVGRLSSEGGAVIVDPTRTPAVVDSVGIKSFFISISPDRRWIAYQVPGVTGVQLQPWPARDRRWLVDADGTEPRWASGTELVYLSQYRAAGVIAASVYRTRIDPNARSPVGSRELVVRDPRFADTPGWSTATTPEGEVIYLQSPSENLGFYLRVIPDWVDQMKRAVDAANR